VHTNSFDRKLLKGGREDALCLASPAFQMKIASPDSIDQRTMGYRQPELQNAKICILQNVVPDLLSPGSVGCMNGLKYQMVL
jgi:hypothetical protein